MNPQYFLAVSKQKPQQRNAISQAGKKANSELSPEKIAHLLREQPHRPKPKLVSRPLTKKEQLRDESSSSDESPLIKPKITSQIRPEKIAKLSKEETHRPKPKLISKPQTRIQQTKQESSSSSSEEEEKEQPKIKEKKITTTLNIPVQAITA